MLCTSLMETKVSDKLEAAVELVNRGVDVNIVASSLGLPAKDIRSLHAQSTQVVTRLSPEDQELAEEMRALVKAAVEEAWVTLQFGRPDDKQALIRLLLTRSMGLVGMETTQRFDEMRTEFEGLLSEAREVGEDAAQARSLPIDVDNPN